MSRFRVFVLSLWVTCVCVGWVNSEEGVGEASAELPLENPVVFGGVEVCGPIYDAFLFLGPKDENGKIDPGQIEPLPHLSGLFRAEFVPPVDLAIEFAGFTAHTIQLGDFRGNTQTLVVTWDVGVEDGKAVWAGVNEELRKALGEPVRDEDGYVAWEAGRLLTTMVSDGQTGEVNLLYSCMPTEEEFQARVNSVQIPEVPPGEVDTSNGRQPPERILGTPLLQVLATAGEPTVAPYWRSERVVGLYYEDFDFRGIPCRRWMWFVDGESVYKGYEFAPPFGPRRAVEAFGGFSSGLSSLFGKPFQHIGGEDFDRIKERWLNGMEETVLSLEIAVEPPWLSLETIHRELIREVGDDLRPGGKPIPRYIPPPKDSGRTRHELVTGSARG
jgi:hypothetical protein